MTPPLLSCKNARIDGPEGPLAWQLNAEAEGGHVVLAGHWRALVQVLAGVAHVVAGSVEILGLPAHTAVARGRVGLSLTESLTPRDWTLRDYLRQSAELIGMRPREARRLADAAIDRLGLRAIATRRLAFLDTATRRAAWLAHAILGDPEVVLVERPFEQLDAQQVGYVGKVLAEAIAGRHALLMVESLATTGPDARLVDTADRVLCATADGVIASGRPEEIRAPVHRYLVTPLRNASELALHLREHGVETIAVGNANRLVVTLADDSTAPIVEAALATDAPLAELIPLATSVSES